MKLALFGGTGRTGRPLLTRALADDHHVAALARDPSKLPPGNWKLTIQLGDVADIDAVDDAIFGSDAVICALGLTDQDDTEAVSNGLRNILAAMVENHVARIIVIAGAGILDGDDGRLRMEQDDFPPMLMPYAAEHRRMWTMLDQSDRRWTLICPTYMEEGEATGSYRRSVDQLPTDARPVRFADVAEFAYSQLDRAEFDGQRVGICG